MCIYCKLDFINLLSSRRHHLRSRIQWPMSFTSFKIMLKSIMWCILKKNPSENLELDVTHQAIHSASMTYVIVFEGTTNINAILFIYQRNRMYIVHSLFLYIPFTVIHVNLWYTVFYASNIPVKMIHTYIT